MNIVLKKPTVSDAIALYATIARNREHLTNLNWVANATLDSTVIFLDSMVKSKTEHLMLIAESSSHPEIYGVVTLRHKGDYNELGFWLDHAQGHRGIMINSVKEMLRSSTVPVRASVRTQNKRSRCVLERSGFILVGNSKTSDPSDEWVDYQFTDIE